MHWWSDEELAYLRKHYASNSIKELLDMFNHQFNVAVSLGQLKGTLKRYGIQSGRTGCFEKGHVPANKGRKGVDGWEPTQFKKGHKPSNYKPIGTERVDRDGYVLIKVSDEGPWNKRWRHKHKVLWEAANGPVPKGHCLLFLDRDKSNITLENLQVISQSQLARLNQNHLISDDPELTKTGLIIADIYKKIGNRKKK